MQFHQDGFRPGDPTVADPTAALGPSSPARLLPAEVDVLIVGSGPTGLTLAAQLAAFPDISVCIAEAKPGPLELGQADGIACRTMEMFQAFGIADLIEREAYQVNEVVFWKPDPDRPEHIRRSGRIPDVEEGLSEMPHVILNQARVHDRYLEVMRNAERPIVPDYSRRLVDLIVPIADGERSVARLERTDKGHEGEIDEVRARYVIGCDGARSQVRRSIGRELVGDAANQAWGVMDVLAVTDFPDIRCKAVVHSSAEGNLLVIPREGGYLVRLYIELDALGEHERAADRDITVDRLIETAGRILAPFTIDVHEVAWWSVYEIGQRLCDKYDDVPAGDESHRHPKVFIAGDACHTHSPKAGQGMNVSMRDAFNLGWKIASVLRGQCEPSVLHTYSVERWAVAKELIDFDRELARMFSAAPTTSDDETGVDPAVFQRYFEQSGRFTAGVATNYAVGLLTGDDTHQHLANGFVPGMRFHSAPVIRVADGKPLHLGHIAAADGRWRLYAFADEHAPAPSSNLFALCQFLDADPRSPVVRYTPTEADCDAVFDLRAVLQQRHDDVTHPELPVILRPTKGRFGLVDYEKVFSPDLHAGPDIFDARRIDRDHGALVVVRPDQHIAQVLPLDAFDELAEFFDAFMLSSG
ncbi:MAG: FAD-binding monooxygenase [Ilumatobacteraceae bacterium]